MTTPFWFEPGLFAIQPLTGFGTTAQGSQFTPLLLPPPVAAPAKRRYSPPNP